MLADNLRFLRQSRQLNQVQLSQKIGVKKQTISNWESGNIMPSVRMLEKIADFYNVTTDFLLDRTIISQEKQFTLDVNGLNDKQLRLVKQLVNELRGNTTK